jgi:DNA modification methylase
MYYYPDNLQESILVFQKGDFEYDRIPEKVKKESEIDRTTFQKNKWYLSVWYITNVLPNDNRLEKGIAAFPDEIPRRLLTLYSYKNEVVLDPFMGSGTTLKVALELGRRCVGYEIDLELLEVVKEKLKVGQSALVEGAADFEIAHRADAKHLRTQLQEKVKKKRKRTKQELSLMPDASNS